MSKDFEQIGHKNIELLRFYINRDLKKIDEKIGTNDSTIAGYFIASLVDILVVILFNDLIKEIISTYTSSIIMRILARIICIIILLVLYALVSCIVKKTIKYRQQKLEVSGEQRYIIDPKDQQEIDDFDNIACDGLLICKNYMQRFSEANKDYEKDFYYYEVIHHLEKARKIFSAVYENKNLYIASKENNYNTELIDSYRINNFIEFSGEILKFLQNNQEKVKQNEDLKIDMMNLKSLMSSWEKIE